LPVRWRSPSPHELTPDQRQKLALEYADHLAHRYGVAVDVAIHVPDGGGDHRNHHAHLLMTTRRLEAEGLTKKTRKLDERKTGEVSQVREAWADLCNVHLERAGGDPRIDHRTLAAQGIDREPQIHVGPKAAAMAEKGERPEPADRPARLGRRGGSLRRTGRRLSGDRRREDPRRA